MRRKSGLGCLFVCVALAVAVAVTVGLEWLSEVYCTYTGGKSSLNKTVISWEGKINWLTKHHYILPQPGTVFSNA